VGSDIFLGARTQAVKIISVRNSYPRVAKGGIKAVTTDIILDSIALVMEDRGSPPKDIGKFFVSLALYKSLSVYGLDLRGRIVATEEMIGKGLHFYDATSLAAMKRLKIKEIVSFDRDFDEVEGSNPSRA